MNEFYGMFVGAVYALSGFQGKLAATINSRVQIFTLNPATSSSSSSSSSSSASSSAALPKVLVPEACHLSCL